MLTIMPFVSLIRLPNSDIDHLSSAQAGDKCHSSDVNDAYQKAGTDNRDRSSVSSPTFQ